MTPNPLSAYQDVCDRLESEARTITDELAALDRARDRLQRQFNGYLQAIQVLSTHAPPSEAKTPPAPVSVPLPRRTNGSRPRLK